MTNILLQAQQGGGGMMMLLMMVAIFAIMYFFMIRPQQKQQKAIRNFQNQLAEGMEVIVGSGIYGTVKSVDLAKGTVDPEHVKHSRTEVRHDRAYRKGSLRVWPVQEVSTS